MRSKAVVVLLSFLLLAVAIPTVAQETTGTITGFVKDPTGAVIPNVEVIVRNTSTGLERRVMTGASGEYTATLLPVGNYVVAIEHTGFATFMAKNIVLSVNDRLRVDATLKLGAKSETMTVEANVPLVQTEHSTVGAVVSGDQVLQTPLNGRSLYQLLSLQPGVSAASGLLSGRVGYGLDVLSNVSVNGMRFAQNNWLIDGGDNVDTGSNLGLINYVSIDAVSEFRILRGNYSAEFGRSGGGQINVITKSGGNSYHGSAYEFLRNDIFDSRPYLKPTCDSITAAGGRALKGTNCGSNLLRYNDFGGNVGGPVFKNKFFFFFSEEVRRVRQVRGTGVINTRVPTDLEKKGDFSQTFDDKGKLIVIKDPVTGINFPGNVIPSSMLDKNALALLSLWPAPNATPALLGGVNNYTVSTPSSRNYREEVLRLDWNVSQKHTLFFRYMQDKMPSVEPFNEVFGTSNADLPNIFSSNTTIPAKNIVGEWNWIPTSNIVNNFAFNYSKGAIFSEATGQAMRKNFTGFTSAEIFPFNASGSLPAIGVGGYASWGQNQGGAFAPYFNTYGSHRIKDTLAWNRGKHALKFGYVFSWEFKNENAGGAPTNGSWQFPSASSGGYVSSGNGFANFLLGRASSYSESDIDMFSELKYKMHEAFVQDDFKVLPNLTLNLGARWSYILQPVDDKDRLTNFVPSLFDPAKAMGIDASGNRIPGSGDPMNGIIIAGQNSPWGRAVTENHPNTVGPRVGFAWDPWKDGKTSVRGGYGIYFDRTLSGIALQNAFVNPPFVTGVFFGAATATNLPTFSNPSGGSSRDNAKVVPGTILAMSPDFMIPTTQQWSFGIQRELPLGLTLDMAYVGNHGTHLLREVRINQTPPGAATSSTAARAIAKYRGYQNIRVRDTSASSRYDALQIGLNRKMAKGLQFGMAYTWGKTITDSPDDRSTVPQSIFDLGAERALASFDKRHVFVTSWVYQLPFFRSGSKLMYNLLGGWDFGGLMRLETGTPLSFFTSGDPSNSFFGGSERLDLIGNPEGPRTAKKWFNTAAFAFPGTNKFGNSRRSIVGGPGLWLTDLSFYKNFKVTERIAMQFRGDMFNAFNHTNYSGVSTTADANYFIPGKATNTPRFGEVTSTLNPREVQLGFRVNF